ncbi:hypothetical protein J6590_004552 [Homalodisca vitripennis]|nr:hypothetical protein J6590_004552 [Homalodisca vitripennis]
MTNILGTQLCSPSCEETELFHKLAPPCPIKKSCRSSSNSLTRLGGAISPCLSDPGRAERQCNNYRPDIPALPRSRHTRILRITSLLTGARAVFTMGSPESQFHSQIVVSGPGDSATIIIEVAAIHQLLTAGTGAGAGGGVQYLWRNMNCFVMKWRESVPDILANNGINHRGCGRREAVASSRMVTATYGSGVSRQLI